VGLELETLEHGRALKLDATVHEALERCVLNGDGRLVSARLLGAQVGRPAGEKAMPLLRSGFQRLCVLKLCMLAVLAVRCPPQTRSDRNSYPFDTKCTH
jgi:hypothetical protein